MYGLVLVVTGFLACGISGCSGGGFGPSYAPRQARTGLLVAGLVLVPLALLLLRGRSARHRALGATAAVAGGSLLAALLLRLGPDGCPWGRAAVSSDRSTTACAPPAPR